MAEQAHLFELKRLRDEMWARRVVRALAEQVGLHLHVERIDAANRLPETALEARGLEDALRAVEVAAMADALLQRVVINVYFAAEGAAS